MTDLTGDPEPPDGFEDPTVLVVDDDQNLADTYAIWLEQEGYGVETTYSGEGALHALHRDVDVVLLDRRMPSVPGDEVLREVRRRDGEYQVSMLTAVAPDADIVDMPFDEYLVKPVTKRDVMETVEELLLRDTLDDDLEEFFVLCSKLSTLETRDADHLEDARQNLRERVERKREEVEDRLEDLDDPTSAYSLVD